MTQRTMSKTLARMLALCLMLMLALSMMAGGAYATNDRVVKVRIDPEDTSYLNILATDCVVTILPTDNTKPECEYDTGALNFQQAVYGEKQRLVFSSKSGKKMGYDAQATVYVPRDAYEGFFIEGMNAELMLMEGISGNYNIIMDNSRISIQYTDMPQKSYTIDLYSSTCDFAFPEAATGYQIKATVEKGQVSVPAGGMREYKGGGTYEYTSGTASTVIITTLQDGSNLNFAFIRKAD